MSESNGSDAARVSVLEDPRVEMPAPQVSERAALSTSGWWVAGLATLAQLGGIALFVVAVVVSSWWLLVLGVLLFVAGLVTAAGLTAVAPGEARVVQLLGRYQGTIRTDGLRWVNP